MKTRFLLKLILIAFIVLITFSLVQAKSTTWNMTIGGAWTTAGNWTNGVPVAGDDVIINSDQSAAITAHPAISLNSLTISGNCNLQSDAGFGSTRLITVTGTFSISSGKTLNLGISGTGRTDFTLAAGATGTINGTLHQYTSTLAARTITINGNLTISSSGKITGQNSNSNFTLGSGATLQIGSVDGITTTGATGNVQSSGTRSYSVGANYVYNGTAAQNTGTGYPTGLTGSLTIDNAAGVTIVASARTITTGNLNLVQGVFATNNGGNRLSIGSTATVNRSDGSMTGTLQGAGAYDVNYTGNSKTAGPELNNTGLRNVTVNLTSGQTITLDANRTPDGNLTITAGIFDLSTLTIDRSASGGTLTVFNGATLKIGGTNTLPSNYSTHSIGNSSIIEYSGANQSVAALNSSQTYGNLVLSGSGTKTFAAARTITNNLSTSGTAKASLANGTNSTAGTLTLGGSGTPNGSWGSTSSSALHKNDIYFLTGYTGILNVGTGTCPSVAASVSGHSNISCYLGNDGSIIIDASGGKGPYTFSLNNGSSYVAGDTDTRKTFSGLTAGTYYPRVKDANDCESPSCP
jgi:hypothetical protein